MKGGEETLTHKGKEGKGGREKEREREKTGLHLSDQGPERWKETKSGETRDEHTPRRTPLPC